MTVARALAEQLLESLNAGYVNSDEMELALLNKQYEEDIARLTAALAQREKETWEQAAQLAENNFPFAATDGERLALHQCLRIAEKCRQQAKP